MSKIFHADVNFAPEYFNRVLNATVPECFKARCVGVKHFKTNVVEMMEEELTVCGETHELAVKYMIAELKNRGLTGRLRVFSSYKV